MGRKCIVIIFANNERKSIITIKFYYMKNIFILFLLFTFSCQQSENGPITPKELDIEGAKKIYEKFLESARIPNNNKETILWEMAVKRNFKNRTSVIFAPILESRENISFRKYSNQELSEKTFRNLFTPTYLTIYIDKEGKEHLERLVLRSTEEYLKKDKSPSFSGIMWYEDMGGEFLRGLVYNDGKVIKSLNPPDENRRAKITDCINYTITITYYTITYSGGQWNTPRETDSDTFTVTECYGSSGGYDDSYPYEVDGGGSSGDIGIDPNYLSDFWAWVLGLNPAESEWLSNNMDKALKVWQNARKASTTSWTIYGCTSVADQDGSNQNAFKHALWIALNACSFDGAVALTIAMNHEYGQNPSDLNYEMDSFNNSLGLTLYMNNCYTSSGSCTCTSSDIINLVQTAINTGGGRRYVVDGNIHEVLFNTSNQRICND